MKRKLLYIAAAALLFCSCSDQLFTEPEGGKVSDEQLTELINKDADAVLAPMMQSNLLWIHNGYYSEGNMYKGIKCWSLALDLQGNDMVLTLTNNWYKDMYMLNNLRQQTSRNVAEYWYTLYKIVYRANQILDLMPEQPSDAALIYKAQALTYRALGYYYLMNIYQVDYMHGGKDKPGVPLHLTVGGAKGRTPSTEVYSTIITDLENAINTFEEQGYDPMSSTSDIDQSVANMLLARIALTTGDYTTAANAAAAVIAKPYTLMNEEQYTTSGFQSVSLPETIWGYTYSGTSGNGNSSFASYVSLTVNEFSQNKGVYMAIDNRLYDQIPDTDYRKKNFLSAEQVAKGGEFEGYPQYTNIKFNTPTYEVDEVYMRLSEAYLLKAEAEARGGNDAAAQQTLYDLVSKRDSGYTKSSKTGDALLEEIYLQSRIELWGEGHEFFTNKRFNKGIDRKSSSNHSHKVAEDVNVYTYQIPLSIEINSNPYITSSDQNPL